MRRLLKAGLVAVGTLLICAGAAYYGWVSYLRWREQRAPSTAQIVVLRDGRQIVLAQPTSAAPSLAASSAAARESTPAGDPPLATPIPAVPWVQPVLPPERLQIAKIDLDWPVVLSHNDDMPRFKGVGWMLGSAVPGAAGNMVLFGHAGGAYGVFERLHELEPGDEITVMTQRGTIRYRVQSIAETTPDDVTVLLPHDEATATLITCSGPWDAALQSNVRRLIVVARMLPTHGQ